MTGPARFALLLLVVAVVLLVAGCASLPGRVPDLPPYVGADCMTRGGELVQVIGSMPGGWWQVRGGGTWMLVPAADLGPCL